MPTSERRYKRWQQIHLQIMRKSWQGGGANHNEMEEEAERAGLIFEEDVMALVKELR